MAKILIVEDNHDLLEFFCLLMEKHGFEVKGASSRIEIDSHLLLFKPDLIMMDVMLHGEDGRDICKEIKSNHKHLPIILLSGNPQVLSNFSEYHADDVIEKPFTIGTVINKVKEIIAQNSHKKLEENIK